MATVRFSTRVIEIVSRLGIEPPLTPELDRVMFKSIQVSNFRSLRDVKVQKLKRINLVTGSNGGGKTSFLEAIFLNAGAANANLAFSVNAFRGDNVITPVIDRVFRSWFWD